MYVTDIPKSLSPSVIGNYGEYSTKMLYQLTGISFKLFGLLGEFRKFVYY